MLLAAERPSRPHPAALVLPTFPPYFRSRVRRETPQTCVAPASPRTRSPAATGRGASPLTWVRPTAPESPRPS